MNRVMVRPGSLLRKPFVLHVRPELKATAAGGIWQ